ncbi:MAG: putative Ig domain-containing protein [Acidobacteriota bacterium]|nr:putative Ig domain-containing protein [Acidobacteriota bacterium]
MRTANTKRFRIICLALLVAMGLSLALTMKSSRASAAANLNAARQLSFDERVAYQRAIEEVYWRGRIWPAANAQPKPSLDAVMPSAKIKARVADYLRKSQALEEHWQRPITAEQLQAEMDRMAKETRQPEVLRELHRALGNDPLVIAECLARPALVERLIRNWYAHDERFHGELKDRAERELLTHSAAHQLRQTSGEYSQIEWALNERAESRQRGAEAKAVTMNAEEWQTETRQFGQLREDEARFYVTVALEQGKDRMKVAVIEWRKEPFEQWWAKVGGQMEMAQAATGHEYRLQAISAAASACADDTWATLTAVPSARERHTAVWTGSEMIVWGGSDENGRANTGGRYNPATNTWTATSRVGAPTARNEHTAVWTGSEMIVWGGYAGGDSNTGGRYNPASDTWGATSTAGAPAARNEHSAVWTGSEMIVWGGYDSLINDSLNTGGRYNPVTDSWSTTSLTNAPVRRYRHTVVWTGNEMIVWAGNVATVGVLNTGGRYNPATDTWTPTSLTNAPTGRDGHTAVWTGSVMIVWGGLDGSGVADTGGRYNPATNTWAVTSPIAPPTARHRHTAVWTGSEMIVWGGRNLLNNFFNTGGRYNPASNSWSAANTVGSPTARIRHTAVWTGSEMIIWGGQDSLFNTFDTGSRYNPSTNNWTATSVAGVPTARDRHTAVWTGSEMIVWGGNVGSGVQVNTGGRYNPAIASWTPTTIIGAPAARDRHTAVWTGSEMIVWGGWDALGNLFNTGGRYNPASNSWSAANAVGAPTGRIEHTAVWTGSEMIVWSGNVDSGGGDTGGRYNPASNSWSATATVGAPTARERHTAVWTGNEMIVWGGQEYGASDPTNTGGRYNPANNSWSATNAVGAPDGRDHHTAVWAGSEMIVWGGEGTSSIKINTGGRYNPASDSWSATTTAGAPAGRIEHTAVWTGSEMIVWGGSSNSSFNSGGRYNPASNSWSATSLIDAPAERRVHTAVWTGSEMIVWGGYGSGNFLDTGGRYCAQGGTANTPPTIAGTALTRTAGSPAANAQIAAVDDAEDARASLAVTVNGGASATVNGVTVSGLSVNSSGQVIASVVANCTATTAVFTLRVTDSGGLFDEATLNVTVNPNTPPSLGTYPATTVAAGGGATVSPNVAPSDNGAIASITAIAPGFSGMLTGNPATGAITITNANPPGNYTVTVTATDNCGAMTNRSFTLTVNSTSCLVAVNPAAIKQPYIAVPYVESLSASPTGSYTFSVSAGALPPGLKLVTTFGVTSIAGLPTTPGTFSFTIKAKRNNSTCEGTRNYTVTIPATVVPILECVQRNANGTYTARFGYDNSTGAVVTILVGSNNYFTPGSQNRGQTTVFQPGRVVNAFNVTFTKGKGSNLAVWNLRGSDGVLRPVSVVTTSIGCP